MAGERRRLEFRLRAQLVQAHLQQQLEAAERQQARHDELFARLVRGELHGESDGEEAERESRDEAACAEAGAVNDVGSAPLGPKAPDVAAGGRDYGVDDAVVDAGGGLAAAAGREG